MKKIKVFITTYNRPRMLLSLLEDIRRESRGWDVSLLIINDHSKENYKPVKEYLSEYFQGKFEYIENGINCGKKYYWKTINTGYLRMAREKFDYFIQLADDMNLVDGFFKKAVTTFRAIPDTKLACLNISADWSRLMKPFWTPYIPHDVSFGKTDLVKTGWMDMCFIASHRFFEVLSYMINPVDPRWSSKAGVSSGVGMQISRRLISQGMSIYSVKRSLVISDDHPSVMHPEHRKETKLLTNHTMDKIIAGMATFPGREDSLKEVIISIINQVDELRVYANNYSKPPIKFRHRKLKWFLGNAHQGDLGDAGKFYGAEQINGYHFTIDDDLIYPADYVATMIAAIERYERRVVVSLHGRSFPPGHIRSYYHGATGRYSCLRTLSNDVFVHVVGTGVLAYHTDTIRIPFEIFQATNMADVWFSVYCQEKKVPRLVVKHQVGWIKDSGKYDQFTSIYHKNVNDDAFQTNMVNTVVWTAP